MLKWKNIYKSIKYSQVQSIWSVYSRQQKVQFQIWVSHCCFELDLVQIVEIFLVFYKNQFSFESKARCHWRKQSLGLHRKHTGRRNFPKITVSGLFEVFWVHRHFEPRPERDQSYYSRESLLVERRSIITSRVVLTEFSHQFHNNGLHNCWSGEWGQERWLVTVRVKIDGAEIIMFTCS